MGWSGTGVFNRLYSWTNDAAASIKIRSDRMDADTNDIAANGLGNCITRDGQGIATANISWGGFKITNIALATTTGDALSYGRAASLTTLAMSSTITGADNGTWGASGMQNIGGLWDLTATQIAAPGATLGLDSGGGGSLTVTGFGITTIIQNGAYIVTGGNLDMVNTSNGVRLTNGATSWAAISDYRAKNVAGEWDRSGAIIDAVPVHLAAMKSDPENYKAMFLAHEVQGAVPYAVHGEKDGEEMQNLESTDPLVPILWAEVRSLRARLAAAGL